MIRNPMVLKNILYIVASQILLALFAYFVILPYGTPLFFNSEACPGARTLAAILMIGAGFVGVLMTLLIVRQALLSDDGFKAVITPVRHPVIVTDREHKYRIINPSAAAVLGITGDVDVYIGQSLASSIVKALPFAGGDPYTLNYDAVVQFGKKYYQISSDQMPGSGQGDERMLLVLREVTTEVILTMAVREMESQTTDVAASARGITGAWSEFSGNADRQADALKSILKTLEVFRTNMQTYSKKATEGSELATRAKEAAIRSGSEISNALEVMQNVQEAGVRVSQVAKLIDDIAFQTNLLALNAAVEAARAGRQGKGFAVVADEVRNLAGRSAKAAKDTATMMDDVTEHIRNANEYIARLGETLNSIVDDTITLADSSVEASRASASQVEELGYISNELSKANEIAHGYMEMATHTSSKVNTLTSQIDKLEENLKLLLGGNAVGSRHQESEPEPKTLEPGEYRYTAPQHTGYAEFTTSTDPIDDPFANSAVLHTADGDSLVQPNQTISLDDKEFGRY